MAAAAGGSIQQSIVEAQADIREAKEQLQGAVGDERVALQQRLAALEQQKLLLMQSGATGWSGHTDSVLVCKWPTRKFGIQISGGIFTL
jgi:hypothetical protein